MVAKASSALAVDLSFEEENSNLSVDSNNFIPMPLDRRDALILDHREHGKRLAWSFLTHWRVRMRHDEVISVVGAALCEAASRFDETRGVSFKTFFFYHLRGMLLKEIARAIQEQKVLQFLPHTVVSDPSQYNAEPGTHSNWILPMVESNNPERILEKREIARLCWEACSKLDSLEQEVLIRHFVNDEPLIEIAENLNYCRCHISRVKSRALAKLERNLSSSILKEDGVEEKSKTTPSLALDLPAYAKRKGRYYTGGRGRRKQTESYKLKQSRAA